MSNNIEVGVVMNLVDRFSRRTRRINTAMTRVSKTGQTAMRSINRSAQVAGRTLDRIGNRYTGLLTGVGAAGTIRSVANFDKRLVFLGIQANKTEKEIASLRDRVFEVAEMPDIRLDPNQLLDGVDKIVEKTGDLDLALTNLENVGRAVRASNSMGGDIGAMVADIAEKFDVKTDTGLNQALDLLVNQGKAGAFTLQNLATQGERVTAAYAATGRTGLPAIREMGAMLQSAKKGTGSPEQAATAFEALLRTLQDAKKQGILKKAGIRLVDPEDPKRMRAVTDIVKDVVRKTGGDISKLSMVFDGEAIRGLNAVASEFKKTGGFASLDGFLNQSSDGTQLMKDASRGVNQLEASLTGLHTAWKRYSFEKLERPMKGIVDALNGLDPDTVGKFINGAVIGTGVLGAAIVGRKVAGLRGGAAAGLGKGAGLSGLASKAAPIPVWVVNGMGGGRMPGAIRGKFGTAAGTAGMAASRAGRLGRAARFGGKVAMPIFVGANALEYADGVLSKDMVKQGRASGTLSGGAAGVAAGALAGSAVPGIGTAIGAVVGGVLGSIGGSFAGEKIGENAQQRMDIRVQVDQNGTVRDVSASSPNSDIDLSVDRGVLVSGGW